MITNPALQSKIQHIIDNDTSTDMDIDLNEDDKGYDYLENVYKKLLLFKLKELIKDNEIISFYEEKLSIQPEEYYLYSGLALAKDLSIDIDNNDHNDDKKLIILNSFEEKLSTASIALYSRGLLKNDENYLFYAGKAIMNEAILDSIKNFIEEKHKN